MVPWHCERDLLLGNGHTQIVTLVERETRFVMLVRPDERSVADSARPVRGPLIGGEVMESVLMPMQGPLVPAAQVRHGRHSDATSSGRRTFWVGRASRRRRLVGQRLEVVGVEGGECSDVGWCQEPPRLPWGQRGEHHCLTVG